MNYQGSQVVTVANYTAKDIGGIGKELDERIGSGKYDSNRTPYNIVLVDHGTTPLLSSVYDNLYKNNVEFNKKKKDINLLDGLIITSGQEFFESLGMEFVDTGEVYKTGDNKGKQIKHVLIDNEHQLTDKARKYFDLSFEFIVNYVGKENIRYCAIHLDELTPHMHIYFTPVVNSVLRKVFATDENGHRLTKEITKKDGTKKQVPIQLKNENGKNVYKKVEGKFLNHDQFWKQKGGNASYTLLQDDFNEYMKENGFNLFRGEIGGNKTHLTNAMKQQQELQAQNEMIKSENELLIEANKSENKIIDKVDQETSKDILNPVKKGIIKQYKDIDIENLSTYSKELIEDNIKKTNQIKKLNKQVENFESGNTYKNQKDIIKKQKEIIEDKDNQISYWQNKFEDLKQEFILFKKKVENKIYTITDKLLTVLHIPHSWNDSLDTDYAIEKANQYLRKNNKSRDDSLEL